MGFHIIRHYFDESNAAFEVTLTIYPPERMEYAFDLVLTHTGHGAR